MDVEVFCESCGEYIAVDADGLQGTIEGKLQVKGVFMRSKKGVFCGILLALGLVFLNSCSFDAAATDTSVKVTGITFTTGTKTIAQGEVSQLLVTITPAEAKSSSSVEYSTSSDGYVSLTQPSNEGVVVTGLKSGSVVIIAKCGGFTAYCDVTVSGNTVNTTPYISIPLQVVELVPGNKKSVTVSLYNGSAADNAQFTFQTASAGIASVDFTGNTVVITAVAAGSTKITVHHPNAEYDAQIIVFVESQAETPIYITSSQNVMTLTSLITAQLYVTLCNGVETDKQSFTYSVKSGSDVVSILSNNNVCNVTALKSGSAVITVHHPKATYDLDVLVIVSTDTDSAYIELDSSFILLSGTEGKMVNASIIGDTTSTAQNNYTYTLSETGIATVQQANNSFYIVGVKNGTLIITITNSSIKYSRQLLVVVQDNNTVSLDKYITTSQNILQLEVGQSATTLQMLLIGGSEADKNNFAWTVDDSSIISVDSADGKVTYSRSVATASTVPDTYMASALVTPKSAGTTKITLTHPKCAVGTTVIVKVYPKGTFASNPIVLANATPLTKVVTGSSTDVTLTVSSGAASDIGTLTWETGATGIATVAGSALAGSVSGISSGSTTLTVKGDNLYRPYTGTVLVGSASELANAKTIYVDNQYVNITSKQTSYIKIRSNNDALDSSITFSATCDNTNVAYVRMVGATLIVQGLDVGTATVTVSNTAAPNTVQIAITVEASDVSIDYPYYLTGDNFIGVVKGATGTYTVDLVNAPVAESNSIAWTCADSTIVTIAGNGTQCKITALANGQTTITAKHSKALDGKKVIVYVASTQAELDAMYVMTVDKQNYLMAIGGKEFIKLTTNGTEAQKSGITWSVDDASVVSLDDNYDSGYITAVAAGNATITIKHANANDLKIYVSVSANQTDSTTKSIAVPSIIEMVVGDNRTITPTTSGMTYDEKNAITWAIKDTAIASLSDAGDSAYVFAKKTGQTYLTVSYAPLNFKKDVLLVCADSAAALSTTYVMALEKTFMSVTTGDVKNLSLVFGSAGFPEAEKPNITWTCTSNNVLSLYGNGATAQFVANNPGVAVITVTDSLCSTPVTLKVEVTDSTGVAIPNAYSFSAVSMKGIVVGNTETISAVLYDGNGDAVTSGLSSIQWAIDDPTIASITANETTCYIKGLAAGQTYLTISHPKVAEKKRILIYVAATAAELTSMYPLSAEKTNYLITVGQTVTLDVGTIDNDTNNQSLIKWAVTGSTYFNATAVSKTRMTVTGKAAGSGTIVVTHPNAKNAITFYISVKESGTVDTTKTMVTESIIGIVKGNTRSTSVITNMVEADKAYITWSAANGSVCAIDSSSGASAVLNGKATGYTTITVAYGETVKRTILVYVCDTQAQLDGYCAINVDNNYRYIKKGEDITVKPFFGASTPTSASTTTWTDVYQNKVASCSVSSGVATFTGMNEGIAVYKVTNPSCPNTVYIYIEVSGTATNTVNQDVNTRYMSMDQNLYVFDPSDTLTAHAIAPTFIGFSAAEILKTEWKNNNPDIISMYGSGGNIQVYANKTGTATISVYNPYSLNMLTITVVIGSATQIINTTTPYIYADKTEYGLTIGDTVTATAVLKNVTNPDTSKFVWSCDNSTVVSLVSTANTGTIKAKTNGQALITVTHPDSNYSLHIVVSVTGSVANVVYLTTTDNYSILEKGAYKTLNVTLKNYSEVNMNNFTWVSEDPSIATVTSSGTQAVVTGVSNGTVRIKITHEYAPYPLYVYVKVTDATTTKPVYISSSFNVMSIVEGSSTTGSVTLQNGSDAENSLFTWTNKSSDIIQVVNSGNYAVIKGLKAGVGHILIGHPSSMNSIDVVVIVTAKDASDTYYITTDDSLIEMKPTDTSKKVSVKLIGGATEDIYGFIWTIQDFTSTEKYTDGTNKPVVSVISSADQAYIKPINEGTATIRITHPKTSYKLDIKVTVTLYKTLNFASESTSVNQNDSVQVAVTAPTGETVIYESSDESIATATGTKSVCIIEGHKAGTAVITGRTASGSTSDQIVIKVNAVASASVVYVYTPTNIVTMNENSASQSVTATLKGDSITEADQENLVWSLDPTTSVTKNSVIALYGTSGQTCAITPVGIGDATIYITHPKSTATTTKKLYVQITASDYAFSLESFKILTLGDVATVTAAISGTSNIDYSKMVWDVSQDTEVVSIVGNKNDCQITAKAPGTAKVLCNYLNTIKYCEIQVNDQNVLTCSTYMTIVPNVTKTLTYTAKPAGTVITATTDTGDYVSIVHDEKNDCVKITGLDKQGYTILTLKGVTTGLTSTCTIYTNYDYQFYTSESQIVTLPNTVNTLSYNVNPEEATIKYELQNVTQGATVLETGTVSGSSVAGKYVSFTPASKLLTVTVPKTGVYSLVLNVLVNGTVIKSTELPIYCYYPNFTLPSPSVTFAGSGKSTRTAADALHMAPTDTAKIDIFTNIATTYPNSYSDIDTVVWEYGNTETNIYASTTGTIVSLSNIDAETGTRLISSKYIGLLKISYKLYTEAGITTKIKSFMVYKDIYGN